jgi:ketosteroid isomerase-like protein
MSEVPGSGGERPAPAEASTGIARQVLDALGHGDVEGFVRLLHPDVDIHTARGVRRGTEEARDWASRTYEHLERRYAIEEMHVAGESVLVLAQVQYVWRESGEVGNSAPVAVELAFERGRLRRWQVHDDPAEGLKVFEQAVEQRGD